VRNPYQHADPHLALTPMKSLISFGFARASVPAVAELQTPRERGPRLTTLVLAGCLLASACASKPLVPFSTETPPLMLVPTSYAGIVDKRGRFREIYCAVLEGGGGSVPDYRPCEEALTRVADEQPSTGKSVDLGPSKRRLVAALVPGVGWDCVDPWLKRPDTFGQHLRTKGYDFGIVKVDALSGSASNAKQVRDAIMAMPTEAGAPRIVLMGYSKGAPDILEAVVAYPEMRSRIAAVVSVAGSVGGSPLANDAEQYQLEVMRLFPGATCGPGDGGAVASMRTETRRAWLAQNPLPDGVRYYSLVTFPHPDRISSILKPTYNQLARVDGRNDGQVIFYDQMIPKGTLVGFVNADHWAIAVPIARTHEIIGASFVDQNAYPREALLEAVLRFVEEDLASGAK
jgi:hypothetical protein